MAVKFSFLFLFRKLIDRIPPLITYWWFVIAFNIVAFGYGLSTYFLICPRFNDPKLYECSLPAGIAREMRHGIAQTAMDVIGDLLILYIPINLIWKIQIRWRQKIPLVLSLCLTVVAIMVSITRVAGIKIKDHLDQVWSSYFLIVAAEVGIILASVSTYRAFFVSWRKGDANKAKRAPGDQGHRYSPTRQVIKRFFTSSPWRSKAREQSSPEDDQILEKEKCVIKSLPPIPSAHLTGMRTFIDGHGQWTDDSQIMESQTIEEFDDDWPLRRVDHNAVDKV
ncbi:MAG: hypothetical protein Q9181_006608 [Wetmoreana brouardii]